MANKRGRPKKNTVADEKEKIKKILLELYEYNHGIDCFVAKWQNLSLTKRWDDEVTLDDIVDYIYDKV